MNKSPALQRLVHKLYAQYVHEQDRTFLQFVFDKNPTQEHLERCMKVSDIEYLGAGKCILLSYLIHERPDLTLSDYEAPRIKGLISYFRFANMKILSHFSKIGKAFNDAGIPMLLFKGAAMKVLRPEFSRPMGDVDVLIPLERMQEAVQIGEKLGYDHFKEESNHAVDFHTATESAVDVHFTFFDTSKDMQELHQGILSRATPCSAFGVDFMLPTHEDLCFLVMLNFTKNLREHTSLGGLYFALCDCQFLQRDKQDFDWAIVRKNAALADKELEVRFAAEFMNAIVPQLVPETDKHLLFPADMEDFCNQIIFDEEYFLKRQKECQAIRVVELKKRPWHFGKRIATFLIMKKLRPFPAFIRWYLNTYHDQGAQSAYQ